MKPNFALNLTDDSIALLHRTARGWMEVGSTPLDAPDLGEALNYLRRSALGLAPHGIATKLVIPNSQILYLEVEAPGPDAAYRRAQIRKALEGRTPYAVEDLVFDWRGTGSTVQVAVIARETLDEAEQFATQYRFNPVSFVAIPTTGQFAGEPWFGPSALSATLLPEGDKVERDQDAITIVARELPREAPRADPAPSVVPDAAPDLAADLAPTADLSPKADLAPTIDVAHEDAAAEPAEVHAVTENTIDDPVEGTEDTAPAPEQPLSKLDTMVADAFPSSTVPLVPAPPGDADAPPPFASRRSPDPVAPAATEPSEPGKTTRPVRAAPPFVANTDEARPRPRVEPRMDPRSEARSEPRVTAPVPEQKTETLASAIATSSQDAVPARKSFSAPAAAEKSLRKETAGPVTAPSIPSAGRKPKAPLAKPALAETKSTSTQTFGARTAPQRGKPRHLGLILTIVLLVFLAVVAAWSSFYLASRSDPQSTAVAASDAADIPAVDDEMLADMQDPAELAAAAAAETDPAATDPTTPDPTTPESASIAATTPEIAPPAAVAESAGPAPVAGAEAAPALSPSSDAQDEIFLATVDPRPTELDALALPSPDATQDLAPVAQMPAPPFGTLYQFDANGLIKPTPEGILTPDGVFLIAGKPSRIPPPRPVALIAAAEAAAAPAQPTPAEAALAPVTTPVADPALAGFKPRARPEGLVPASATPAAPEDQTSLAIPESSRLTSLRPHARPAAITALANAARNASAAASLSAPADPTTGTQAEANLSGVGIAVSRKPVARPHDFSKAVEAAVAAAVQPTETPEPAPEPAPEPEPAAKAAIAAAPEAEPEPDVSGSAPRATQRGTVAKQATFANAINLSKLNLIGVYGTSNNRYAMIRQPNGRYKKVQVGDRVDGGTIAAITQNEVRYQKGGRLISLKMPKG